MALAAAAVIFLVMNVLTTLKGDEYVYALMPGDLRHSCNTLADYVRTMPTFYQTTNGRLADAVERLMASVVGKPIFNILNTMVFVLFVEGIFTLAVGRRRSVAALALVLVALMVAFPYPGETLLWMAGACNYLWSTTLLLWLLCWLRYAPPRATWATHLAVLLAAFVAGGFNESATVGCLLGLGIYFVLNRSQFRSIRPTAVLGLLLGLAMILLSPALLHRLEGGNSVNLGLSLMQMVSRRILAVGYMTLRFVTPLLVLVLVVRQWRKLGWGAVRSHPGYCVMAGVMLAALALGMVIERPYTFMVALAMAIVLAAAFDRLQALTMRTRLWCTTLGLLFCAGYSAYVISQMAAYRNYDRQVQTEIQQGPAQCIIEARHSPVTSRWVVPDVYDNTEFNCAYQMFYAFNSGKDNVQFLPAAMLERYRQSTLLDGTVPMKFDSSDKSFTDTILAAPGQNYAFIRLSDDMEVNCGLGKVYYSNIDDVWGQAVAQRRYLLGSYKNYMPIRPYVLVIKGSQYLVIGSEMNDKVTRVEVSVYNSSSNRWTDVTFTQTANN